MARNRDSKTARSFLTTLLRDTRANTLALMAMALIPLAGMVGGGVDISRMYIVKTRLQHACDAGALAGRKAMGGGTWSQTVNGVANYPNVAADKFFAANYDSAAYGATGITHSFTENAGKVSGTASAVLPMTLMRIFGRTTETLSVSCDAEMRMPNTDVMFVLDTTGSMGDTPAGDSQPKIASLKVAVKCFYEIVARLDTDATCTTGTPAGGTGNQVQIRFGFVPYATNVNVGKLLPTAYFADSWTYQTRRANFTTTTGNAWVQQGTPVTTQTEHLVATNIPQANCNDSAAAAAGYNSSNDTFTNGGNTKTNVTKTTHITGWTSASNGTCSADRPWVQTVYNWTTTTQSVFQNWTYDKLAVNVGLLKNGSNWNGSFQWPIASNGTNKTINWEGCIEERATVSQASYSPIPAGAKDLDLDSVPVAGDVTTQWKPALPDLIYTRNGNNSWSLNPSTTTTDYGNQSYYACPVEAKKLQQWPVASDFDTYVDQLTPEGNTYHDIGLTWGGRLMSPTGIFAAENAHTPQGGDIERHMIFMTDGDPCTGIGNYTAYGVAWFDRRTTDPTTAPTDGCTTTGSLTAQVNARTTALCSAIKNKNITLWVITFGYVDPTTVTRLTNCASSGKYFTANNAAQLQATFKSIADQISQLRLTR